MQPLDGGKNLPLQGGLTRGRGPSGRPFGRRATDCSAGNRHTPKMAATLTELDLQQLLADRRAVAERINREVEADLAAAAAKRVAYAEECLARSQARERSLAAERDRPQD